MAEGGELLVIARKGGLTFYTYGGHGECLLVTHAARQAGWEVALLYA